HWCATQRDRFLTYNSQPESSIALLDSKFSPCYPQLMFPAQYSQTTSSQAQNIKHVVEPCGLFHNPLSSTQRAVSERITTTGSMSELNAFAHRSKHDCMVSDYIASPNCLDPDFSFLALPNGPLSRIHTDLCKIPIHGTCQHFRHFQCCTAWRIFL